MKLLDRTLLSLLVYSIVLLAIVTPVLYFIVNSIIISDVDKTLQIHKKEIQSRLEKFPTEEDILHWEDLDGEVFVKPIDKPHEEKVFTKNGYRFLLASAKIKGKWYELEARISLVESDDLIRALVFTQMIVLVVLAAGMLTINWWNSRIVWKPFYDTLNKLKLFNIEKNDPVSLQASSISEFTDLNSAIEELTRRNRQAFVSQREFTENAAHEMQTPLAIFQAKLDILLQTKPSMEQAMVLDALYSATQRLNRLNKGLLLLAKIENNQFHETEEVDLFSLTQRLTKDTEIQIKGRKLVVSINPVLLEVLLSNLISNAQRYSSRKGEIMISIDESSWTISNPGPALSISAEKIFERFQKGTSNKESLGLGLAIARRICDVSGLDLSYWFVNNSHSFTIRFPNSKISPNSFR